MIEDDEVKHPYVWIAILHIIILVGALIYASWQSEEVRILVLTFLNIILGG